MMKSLAFVRDFFYIWEGEISTLYYVFLPMTVIMLKYKIYVYNRMEHREIKRR